MFKKLLNKLDRTAAVVSGVAYLPVSASLNILSSVITAAGVASNNKRVERLARVIHTSTELAAAAYGSAIRHGFFGCMTVPVGYWSDIQDANRRFEISVLEALENNEVSAEVANLVREMSQDTLERLKKESKRTITAFLQSALEHGFSTSALIKTGMVPVSVKDHGDFAHAKVTLS